LAYDQLEAERGVEYPFKAYKLSQTFIELSYENKLRYEKLIKFSSKYDKVFVQLPLEVVRSPLA